MNRLSIRIMLPTVAAVLLAITVFGWSLDLMLEREIRTRAQQEVEWHTNSAIKTMQTIDTLSRETVHMAMKVLLFEGRRIGTPSITGTVQLGAENVPNLKLGNISQVGNFTLVDEVQKLTGATATLVTYRGRTFFPIATNVLDVDGTRALSSFVAEPQDKGISVLIDGKPVYDVYEVMGEPNVTGSEPIVDGSGAIIGLWYVGYPMRGLTDFGNQIRDISILDHGMIAIIRTNGEVLFKSGNVSNEVVLARLKGKDAAVWTTVTRHFEPWDYTVIAAYPELDVIHRVHRVRLMIAGCTLGTCVLVVLCLYLLIARLVLRPLDLLVARMEDADLNTALVKDRGDEIGLLGRAFDRFVTRVREALIEVAKTSEAVVEASERIASGTSHVALSVSTQKTQVARIAGVLTGMSTQVQEVAGRCVKTAETARTAAAMAGSGGGLVRDSLAQMQLIADSVGATSEHVKLLGRRSSEIGRIVGVIDQIARQTNLLALNAAIEAARAGEHGRGFAVVAVEVRSLAERTSDATREIEEMVQSIQAETRTAIERMEAGTRAVAAGVATTGHAGSSLKQIVGDAERVGEMVGQIAAATTEQVHSAEQVSWSVDEITRFAGESADGAQKSAMACEELTYLALQLQGLVGRFRLDGYGAETETI